MLHEMVWVGGDKGIDSIANQIKSMQVNMINFGEDLLAKVNLKTQLALISGLKYTWTYA